MQTLSCLVTIAAILLPGLAAQTKPDFSGTWKLDLLRSRMDEASAPKGVTMTIEHQEPKIKIGVTTVTDKGESTYTFDLSTKGTEVKQTLDGHPCAASVKWDDGESLVFLLNRETADGTVTSARRLKLGSEKMLSTVQTLKTKAGESKSYEFYEKQ
jgi:hypothetical protein